MKRLSVIASTGIALALVSQLMYYFFASHPEGTLQWYYAGLFPWIRRVLSGLLSWIPVPFLYVLLVLAVAWLGWSGRLIWKRKNTWYVRTLLILLQVLGVIGFIITFFYWFWGYNYATPSVRQRLNLQIQGLRDSAIVQEYQWITDSLLHYSTIPAVDTSRNHDFILQEGWIQEMNEEVRRTLTQLSWPNPTDVPVRQIWPNGTLLRIATAGFYLPLTGEANFDAGMYPLQWPYVVAHELFHAYGITNEGDCNFLALLTCWNSTKPVFKYSALMAYWRQVASEYRRFHKEDFSLAMDSLPEAIKTDLYQIYQYQDRYPEVFSRMRHAVYNSYLKAHGIQEGMASYNEVIILLAAWKRDHGVPFIPPATTAEMSH